MHFVAFQKHGYITIFSLDVKGYCIYQTWSVAFSLNSCTTFANLMVAMHPSYIFRCITFYWIWSTSCFQIEVSSNFHADARKIVIYIFSMNKLWWLLMSHLVRSDHIYFEFIMNSSIRLLDLNYGYTCKQRVMLLFTCF